MFWLVKCVLLNTMLTKEKFKFEKFQHANGTDSSDWPSWQLFSSSPIHISLTRLDPVSHDYVTFSSQHDSICSELSSLICASGLEAPWWGAPLWIQSLNVLIVRVQSLSVNVLPVSLSECSVSLKYEYWLGVKRRGEKSLLKHREPPHWLHVCCREGCLWYGLVTVRLTCHVVLLKLLQFVTLLFPEQ